METPYDEFIHHSLIQLLIGTKPFINDTYKFILFIIFLYILRFQSTLNRNFLDKINDFYKKKNSFEKKYFLFVEG